MVKNIYFLKLLFKIQPKKKEETLKQLEKEELEKLNIVIKLVKEEIEKNNKLYSQTLQNTENEEVTYYMLRTYETKIKNLEKALLIPYFARVDFKAEDENKMEKLMYLMMILI